MKLRSVLPCLLLGLIPCLGCGEGGLSNVIEVKGKVVLNGEPLKKAIIEFHPTSDKGSFGGAVTDESGNYVLKNSSSTNGVPAGSYTVVVKKIKELDNMSAASDVAFGGKESLPAMYSSRTSSLLKMDVPNTAGYDLTLNSKAGNTGAMGKKNP